MPLKARILRRYEYEDLPGSDWIRLLELLPGNGNQPLKCHIFPVRLGQMPLFEAISYVWGTAQYSFSIHCNGGLLPITTSLHDVLQNFRDERKAKVLWADAICINQTNSQERSTQVRLMDQIYSLASNVLIWLGPDVNGEAQSVFRLIREVNKLFSEKRKDSRAIDTTAHDRYEELGIYGRENWNRLAKLMRSQWFTRLWVIQEVGCASSASLYMGKNEVHWIELMRLLSWLYFRSMSTGAQDYITLESNQDQYSFALQSIVYPWLSYDGTRDIFNILSLGSKTRPSFLEVLDSVRERNCSDPKDRIYAFLNHPTLRAGKTGPVILPAYHLGTVEVYYEFAAKWFEHYEEPYLLSYVFHSEPSTAYNGFPTFVPQWNIPNQAEVLNPAAHRNGYNATRSSSFKPKLLRDRLLRVRGIKIDSAQFSSDRFVSTAPLLNSQGPQFFKIWKKLSEERETRTFRYRDYLRAFALTLTAGQMIKYTGTGKLPQHYEEEHFASFSAYWLRILSALGKPEDDHLNTIKEFARHGQAESFARCSSYICHFRKFFFTQKGYFGLGPGIMQNGDLCCLFLGAEVPYILRPCEDGTFRLIGECYVHEMMHGEAMDLLHGGELEATDFILC